MRINNREIQRVLIIDDDPAARDGYSYPVEDLELEPIKVTDPFETTESFIANIRDTDVVACDYHLRKHRYAPCDGDVLAAECFKAGIPGMLCTSYTDVAATIRRDCLRYIPALLTSNSPEPDSLVEAWKECLNEMSGRFRPTRRPWRTLVRIAEIDFDRACFYVVVPSWDIHKKIRIDNEGVPASIRNCLKPDGRLHAQVNIGAESYEELFFEFEESE